MVNKNKRYKTRCSALGDFYQLVLEYSLLIFSGKLEKMNTNALILIAALLL